MFDAGFNNTAFHVGARVVLLNYLMRAIIKAMVREGEGLTAVRLYSTLVDWPELDTHLRYFANTGGRMPRETLGLLRQRVPRRSRFDVRLTNVSVATYTIRSRPASGFVGRPYRMPKFWYCVRTVRLTPRARRTRAGRWWPWATGRRRKDRQALQALAQMLERQADFNCQSTPCFPATRFARTKRFCISLAGDEMMKTSATGEPTRWKVLYATAWW